MGYYTCTTPWIFSVQRKKEEEPLHINGGIEAVRQGCRTEAASARVARGKPIHIYSSPLVWRSFFKDY